MNLRILFGQRRQDYDGQFAPEPLECWSEYVVDDNPEGFEEACEKKMTDLADEFSSFRIFNIIVSDDFIHTHLNKTPQTSGKITVVEET